MCSSSSDLNYEKKNYVISLNMTLNFAEIRQVFKKVSQNSLESTSTGVSFLIKVTWFNLQLCYKETVIWTVMRFLVNFVNFSKTGFVEHLQAAAFGNAII